MYESDVAIQLKETHHKISQVLQHKIDEYGISFGLLFLTMRIYNNPNANQKELAQQMKFTEGAMSNAVTDLGISMIDDYKEYVVKKYKDMFEGLDEEELKKLQMSLIKINKNLDRMNTNIDSMGKTE